MRRLSSLTLPSRTTGAWVRLRAVSTHTFRWLWEACQQNFGWINIYGMIVWCSSIQISLFGWWNSRLTARKDFTSWGIRSHFYPQIWSPFAPGEICSKWSEDVCPAPIAWWLCHRISILPVVGLGLAALLFFASEPSHSKSWSNLRPESKRFGISSHQMVLESAWIVLTHAHCRFPRPGLARQPLIGPIQ